MKVSIEKTKDGVTISYSENRFGGWDSLTNQTILHSEKFTKNELLEVEDESSVETYVRFFGAVSGNADVVNYYKAYQKFSYGGRTVGEYKEMHMLDKDVTLVEHMLRDCL